MTPTRSNVMADKKKTAQKKFTLLFFIFYSHCAVSVDVADMKARRRRGQERERETHTQRLDFPWEWKKERCCMTRAEKVCRSGVSTSISFSLSSVVGF